MVRLAYQAISVEELGQRIDLQKKAINEITALIQSIKSTVSKEEAEMTLAQIHSLARSFGIAGVEAVGLAEEIFLNKLLEEED